MDIITDFAENSGQCYNEVMLINGSKLLNVPILSLQAEGAIAWTDAPIIDPDSLKIIGFKLSGPLVARASENILDTKSIREYSHLGMVVDSADDFIARDDVVKISKVLDLNFELIGLKVETKKGSKLGKVSGFTCTDNDFMIQQIIVKRPAVKSFLDPELTIPRSEIVEINDYKIIVKDEEKTIKIKAEKEEFVPNFVNPFRKNSEPDYAPAQNQNPDGLDTE